MVCPLNSLTSTRPEQLGVRSLYLMNPSAALTPAHLQAPGLSAHIGSRCLPFLPAPSDAQDPQDPLIHPMSRLYAHLAPGQECFVPRCTETVKDVKFEIQLKEGESHSLTCWCFFLVFQHATLATGLAGHSAWCLLAQMHVGHAGLGWSKLH